MSNMYNLGDKVRCQGTFTDSDGDEQDPISVFVSVKEPGGTITTYEYGEDGEVIKSATGVYYVDLDADTTGRWWYRFYATGSGQASSEEAFDVASSEFDE